MPGKRVVEMIDRDGNVVETYPSLSDAGRDNFMTRQHVRNHCNGRVKDPFKNYDYTFRYKE